MTTESQDLGLTYHPKDRSKQMNKSAAEFMGGINIWHDFYFLTPGLPTSVCNISACFTLFGHQVVL